MTTLIKFFDKDTIKNLAAPLSLKPDKVIFIYDSGLKDMTYFESLEHCFQMHMPNVIVSYAPVNITSLQDIKAKVCEVIKGSKHCTIEFTGGSELMLIGGYMAGSGLGAQLYYTDLTRGIILDLDTNTSITKIAPLSLMDFILAKGATLIGSSHIIPEEERYNDILKMCYILFENEDKWKETCSFFQTAVSYLKAEELHLKCRLSMMQKNGKKVTPDRELLSYFLKFGFIKNLDMTKENIRLTFTSKAARQYIIIYGIWLELYVYIHALKSGVFEDVMLGAMINWSSHDRPGMAGNEFDVLISDNSMPIFISCKMREAATADLNELVIARKRLGGWFSKNILLSFSRDKQNNSAAYRRAKEMGVEFLDKKDIMSHKFEEILVKTIKEQDLVRLKWIKV